MLTATQRVTALAFVFAASIAANAFAQESPADPDGPESLGAETMPEMGPGRALREAQDALRDMPGMMGDLMDQGMMDGPMNHGMTSPDEMGQGMMCSEMCGGMMGQGRMGPGMMDQSQMGGMMHSGTSDPMMMDHGMMGSMQGLGMHDHAMKIMFAIADANDDGGLSLDEIAAIQSRIFNAIDADNDSSVTPEELQAFISG